MISARKPQSNHLIPAHHVVLFVAQDMAVVNVFAGFIDTDQNPGDIARRAFDGVFAT
jgi:hypothetical protein